MGSFVKHISGEIPDRFEWAIEVMNIHSSDNILEIGCGTGILAEQICKTLSTGRLTAIDRSGPMIEKATQRNDRFITSGIASFKNEEIPHADLPERSFDSIVSFNVNFFWKNENGELENIRQLLKPGGSLFIFYQPPSDSATTPLQQIREQLSGNSFTVMETESKEFEPAMAYCIKASIA